MAKRKVKASTKSGKAKLSNIKKGNITANKQRKLGIKDQVKGKQLKRRKSSNSSNRKQDRNWPLNKNKSDPNEIKMQGEEDDDEESEVDEEYENLKDEELHYIKSLSKGSFLKGIDKKIPKRTPKETKTKKTRKSKKRAQENELLDSEKLPRAIHEAEKVVNRKMRQMLPIKDAEGLKRRWTEMEEPETNEEEKEPGEIREIDEMEKLPILPEISTVQLFAVRQEKMAAKKQEIAGIASTIIEDPEKHVKKIKTLRNILSTTDPDIVVTVRKLGMVSLMEVFKDIVPGYRIRDWETLDEKFKLKSEVKAKRVFEECLLGNYKHYLEFLDETIKGILPPRGRDFSKKKKFFELSKSAKIGLAEVACKCLCELMQSLAHFNFRNNIISLVVAMMFFKHEPISKASIACMYRYFREHTVYEGIPNAVSYISKKIKGQHFRVSPKVLDTFLGLRIKETNLRREEGREDAQKRKQERKEKMSKMTRKEKRFHKIQEVLVKEQDAAEQKMGEQEILRLNTEAIQSVFTTYFRVLKTASDFTLLPSVLEGLAKFAHLINISFFDDLIKVFNELITSGVLEYRESLHCVLTAFRVLSGQGESLNIDPTNFYAHLYQNLLNVHAGESSKDAVIIIRCLDTMIFKRHKQITQQLALAYMKRLGSLSLQSLPNACLAFLCAIRAMLKLYPATDILLDTESIGSGVFLPELEEPEHCHAQNTALWELHLLKKHFHPTVRPYAVNLIKKAPIKGSGALDTSLSKRNPLQLFEDFDPSGMVFNPPVLTKPLEKIKASKAFSKRSFDEFLQPDFQVLVDDALKTPKEEVEFHLHSCKRKYGNEKRGKKSTKSQKRSRYMKLKNKRMQNVHGKKKRLTKKK